jgi:hypothetical protein
MVRSALSIALALSVHLLFVIVVVHVCGTAVGEALGQPAGCAWSYAVLVAARKHACLIRSGRFGLRLHGAHPGTAGAGWRPGGRHVRGVRPDRARAQERAAVAGRGILPASCGRAPPSRARSAHPGGQRDGTATGVRAAVSAPVASPAARNVAVNAGLQVMYHHTPCGPFTAALDSATRDGDLVSRGNRGRCQAARPARLQVSTCAPAPGRTPSPAARRVRCPCPAAAGRQRVTESCLL